LKIKLGKVHC